MSQAFGRERLQLCHTMAKSIGKRKYYVNNLKAYFIFCLTNNGK